MRKAAVAAAAGAVLLAAGCVHAPPTKVDPSDVPKAWTGAAVSQGAGWPTRDWWKGFGSNELTEILYEAEANSFDVQTAAQRVIEAEAEVTTAGSSLWPTVTGSFNASRRNAFQTHGVPDQINYSASLGLNYEINIFGADISNRRAAVASLAATRFDQVAVGLDTAAGVATAYAEVLSLRDEIKVAQLDLQAAQQTLQLIQARVNNGAAAPADLVNQQAAVARQAATIPPLQQQERQTLASLAILLGRPASGFNVEGQSLDSLTIPSIQPGLPSELLERRPDVAEAEADLRAGSADVDAARASLFPSIGLSGSAGGASTALQNLFNPGAMAWSIAASATETIFDAGRLGAQVRSARARERELLIAYRQTVLSAFSEVDVTLGLIDSLARQRQQVEIEVSSAREAYRLAQIQYREGATDLTTVLQAQSTLFTAEDQLTQIKLQQAEAAITLYRALGGGWDRKTSGI